MYIFVCVSILMSQKNCCENCKIGKNPLSVKFLTNTKVKLMKEEVGEDTYFSLSTPLYLLSCPLLYLKRIKLKTRKT